MLNMTLSMSPADITMTETARWRVALVTAITGLLLACYASCGDVAFAEPTRVLKPGSTLTIVDDEGKVTERLIITPEMGTWFAVSRAKLDRANATAELNERLTASLMACSGTLAEQSRPKPGWRTALKAGAVTGAILGAFFLGLML